MSSNQYDEPKVPMGIALMIIGAIILLFAGIGGFILTRPIPQDTHTLALLATAPPAPTPLPEPTATEETAVNLLPETPNEAEQLPAHFVSALEAAQPNIGQPLRIVIPDLELDAPVAPIGLQAIEQNGQTIYQWQVPAEYLAGWHHTSARLGTAGNTVLNGHHNVYGEIFKDLNQLEEGAQITLYDLEHSYTYIVSEIVILEERGQPISVRQNNAQWIAETDDERLTLVTCWPYTDNSHRLIVVAYPHSTEDS